MKTRNQIAVECAVYFRHPYSSFEKGASERHNGLLRRFAEKGGSVDDMPAQLISKAADWNNSLPRKILGCKTPAEMFAIEILKTAQGAERPLLLRLPLGERKNIPMASVAFDIAIYNN
ncbi:MAG: hypothetical protein LBU32_27545 [Clostridiales bacterium]|jgi:IS30 family transposase|nr:hypothetical protein [Clostridiales bacterium]